MKKMFIVCCALLLIACESPEQTVEQNGEIFSAPGDYKSDADVWGNTGREVNILGCEQWKLRDPEADC